MVFVRDSRPVAYVIILCSRSVDCFRCVLTGGSLAVLAATELAALYTKVKLITYEAPRTYGPDAAVDTSSRIPTVHRLTHYKDLVPMLPVASWGWQHQQGEQYFRDTVSVGYANLGGFEASAGNRQVS